MLELFKQTCNKRRKPVMDGCVLYLDGRYGGNDPATQTWHDLSGNGNDGALTNFAYNHIFSGWTGEGLEFDGVDDYVDCGSIFNENYEGFTVEALIAFSEPSTGAGGLGYIIHKNTADTEGNAPFVLMTKNSSIAWQVNKNTNTAVMLTVSGYMDGKPHLVHGVYANNAIMLYIDGELKAKAENLASFENNNGLLGVGSSCIVGEYRPFNGTIYGVKLYNRALSDREITQNYLAGRCIMPLRHIDNAVTPAELLQNEIAAKNSPLFHDHYNTAGAEWTAAPLTQMVRLGTTANKTAGSDFDSIYPWSEMKLCNVSDSGEITAYIGDSGFKRDGTNGQVMVKIPKFYYRHVYGEAAKKHQFWISEHPISGFKLHPAFIRAGVEKDYILMGAYKASFGRNQANTADALASVSGVFPAVSQNIGQFRTLAEGRGTKWTQADALTRNAVALLYLVEYADTDSQSAIGAGVTDSTAAIASGGCDYLNGASGNAVGDVGTVSVSYRGLEDLWGNVWEFVDGINIKRSEKQPYIADDNSNFVDNTFTGVYTSSGITLPSGNGYVKDFACSAKADWLLMPTTVGGGYNTYIPDYYYQNWGNSADKVALVGGRCAHGGAAGLFSWSVDDTSSDAYLTVGARVLQIP